MLKYQNYVRAESLDQAWELNQKKQNRIIGGMLWLRMSNESINTVIDLCDLGLNQIDETEDQFSIGSMVTLRQLETHAGLNACCSGAIQSALKNIVGVQFRNSATVGGSIWGRYGFSDVLTVLLAMDTYVELYKGGTVPLEQFTHMKPDSDILVRLILKKTPGSYAYQSVRAAKTDFPTLTCSASVCSGTLRVAVGARPGRAVLLTDSQPWPSVDEKRAEAFAVHAAQTIVTGTNARAGAEYRSRLVKALTKRVIISLGGMEHAD